MSRDNIRIAHISDIHIRMKERHDEYKTAFSNLCEMLKRDKVDRIFLGGDIVHSKISLSPELVHLTRFFFEELANIAPVDLIAGNHDMNVSNLDRMDALTPIVNSVKNTKFPLNYYRDSGLYEVDGTDIVYGVFSLLDNKGAKLTKKNKKSDKIYIGAYHGAVAGCLLESEYELSDASMAVSTFKNYDFTFLGDIHKRQFLNEDKTIAYAGSLIQQNFGETLNKGYLLWDIRSANDFSVEEVDVPNDYGYFTIYSKDDILPNLDLPKKCRIRVIWEKAAKDISRAETSRITSMIYKKYNPLSVQLTFKPMVNDDTTSIDLGGETKPLSDKEVQRDLLKQWLSKRCENSDDVEKIMEIDRKISDGIEDSTMEDYNNCVWSIKGLTIENFMSYVGPHTIDFNTIKGVIGLFGDNAAGKSVVLDSILYALFNKTSRNVKNEDLVNKLTDNPVCKVILDLEIRGVNYRIERWTTRQYKKRTREFVNARTDVVFKRKYNGDEDWENLSETQRNETEKIIRNVVGTFDDFLLTTLSTQNQIDRLEGNEFLSLRPALRSDIMLRFLGLDVFNRKHDRANDIFRDCRREKMSVSEDCEIQHINLERINIDKFKKNIKDLTSKVNKLNKDIKKYNSDITYSHSAINETIKIEKDADTLKQEYNDHCEIIDKLKDERATIIGNIEKLLGKIEQVEQMYTMDDNELRKFYDQRKEADRLGGEIDKIESSINSDKKVLRVYKNDIKENGCPVSYDGNHITCSYLVGYMDKKKECEKLVDGVSAKMDKKKDLEEQFDNIKSCYGIIDEQEKIRDAITKATFNLSERKQRLAEVENKIEVRELSLNLTKSHLDIAIKNEDIIKKNREQKARISELEKKVSRMTNEVGTYSDEIVSLRAKVAVSESKIEEYEKELDRIKQNDEMIRLYSIYCDSMHRTGLPVEILRSYIPTINYEINKILSDVVGFGLFFKIDDDSTDIDIVMRYDLDGDDTRPATMASGMEKLLINFAIRYALISVSNLNKPNTWLIDEGFGVLDSENLYSMSKFFDNIRGMFKNIIMITHIDSLKDISNWVITVEKKDGISTLNIPQKNI